ncbi:phosphotransferase [Candidatus Bathyarchaeota archaeon]|nr:phosphotransferase [Candidatus Bathyarchaeota archaeon]
MAGESGSLSAEALQEYLSSLHGCTVEICGLWRLGEAKADSKDLKGFGYGIPYVIEFRVKDEIKRVVLETMRPGGFGHDFPSDRAQILLWQHSAFNKLPRHVRSVDVGAFTVNGKRLKSLGDCGEFFILTEYVEGELYHLDLDRLKETGEIVDLDVKRCLALSDYLVQIHSLKLNEPQLYVRRVRELVGHGECIMGLLDSYPLDFKFLDEKDFVEIERECVNWRWRLKKKTYRLSQVHGDFHPWNVMFHGDAEFTVLDRSRGEWGEPADDVTAMTVNYIFYSLQKYGQLAGCFERLYRLFWENYLSKTGDTEILEVVQPFYAWRGLVVASPIWYPNLDPEIRQRLLNFVINVLRVDKFDIDDVNSYIKEA